MSICPSVINLHYLTSRNSINLKNVLLTDGRTDMGNPTDAIASKYSSLLQDPLPVQKLVRKEGRRPAILLGLRDNENDYGVIKVMMMMMVMVMMMMMMMMMTE